MELISKNGNIRGFPSQAELTVTPPLQLQTECMTDLRRSVISPPKGNTRRRSGCKIAKAFGVKHHIYNIPDNSNEISDYDLKVEIQRHNSGYIAERKPNESRKRFYLEENCGCDVEVKSWVSETIRGYWYKHFDRKNFRSCPRSFIEISIRYLYLTGSLHTRLTRFLQGI